MAILKHLTALGICIGLVAGCSAKTKEETKEALDATSEAAASAAEDAKVNAKKAGEVIQSGVDKAKEEFRDPPPSTTGDSPADADAVPEAEEVKP